MTSQPTPDQVPPRVTINLPPEEEAGYYADFANVWHNAETFILDFAAMTRPPQLGQDDSGNAVADIHGKVVARVRVPGPQVWEIMKALEQQLTAWEAERSGQRPPPTDQ